MKRYVVVVESVERDSLGGEDRGVEAVYGPFSGGETEAAQAAIREHHRGESQMTATIVPLIGEVPK